MKRLNMIFTSAILVTIALTGFACSQFPGFEGDEIKNFDEIESGYYSSYPDNGEVHKIITSYDEFSNEWKKVFKTLKPTPDLPQVNFEMRTVLLLMLESKPTGGYYIDNIEVYENIDYITVRYSEVQPGKGCITTQAITRPFKIFSIYKTDKEVKFEKSGIIKHNCTDQ